MSAYYVPNIMWSMGIVTIKERANNTYPLTEAKRRNKETLILSVRVLGSSGNLLAIRIRIRGIIKLDMTEPIVLIMVNRITIITIQPMWCSFSMATLYDISTVNGSLYRLLKNCIIIPDIYHQMAADAAITTIAFITLAITSGRLVRGWRAIGI